MTAVIPGHDVHQEVTQTTNVLATFDVLSIMESYQQPSRDPREPTLVDSSFVYCATSGPHQVVGQSGSTIDISAKRGDVVKWREMALSMDPDRAVLLYWFGPLPGGKRLISLPISIAEEVVVPLPKEDDWGSADYDTESIDQYAWFTFVENLGRARYEFRFQVVVGEEVTGFFRWEPDIAIQPRT